MCGFAGFWGPLVPGITPGRVLESMANAIAHRGPDDAGYWFHESVAVGLAHRRLSILDLSPAGHQPMVSASERFVIAFNGEIYNHLALRSELERDGTAPLWRGHSDTETLLASFEHWGIEPTLRRAVGMFAFAVWDHGGKTLTLARDRLGEKPLYYGWQDGVLLFGSELKALRAHPSWTGVVDRRALALYMRHNAIPSPWTIFTGVKKLPPASLLTVRAADEPSQIGTCPEPVPYWSIRTAIDEGLRSRWSGSDAEATRELDGLLRLAVRDQMVADVPLGAFLSGGVDSSTVVALMQAQSIRPVKTFTIGFAEERFNEAVDAKAVALHLGTDHTEMYVAPKDAQSVIPMLPSIYDEPFADASQIPTYLVSRLAQAHVKVALSGDAGDELFGGYNRYFLAARLWRILERIPARARRAAAATVLKRSPQTWDRIFALATPVLPERARVRQPGDKLHKAAGVLASPTGASMYRKLVSQWEPAEVVLGGEEPETVLSSSWAEIRTLTEQMMAWDSITYLPDDILTKVDRAAMAVSLETRVPFLDRRVVEFAWTLPLPMKVRGGQGKRIVRQVLDQYVPRQLIERPKMGFGVPIDEWIRGPLREWAEDLLSESRLRAGGFLRPEPIRSKWAEHLSGKRNWQYHLWTVLMFEAWRDAYGIR